MWHMGLLLPVHVSTDEPSMCLASPSLPPSPASQSQQGIAMYSNHAGGDRHSSYSVSIVCVCGYHSQQQNPIHEGLGNGWFSCLVKTCLYHSEKGRARVLYIAQWAILIPVFRLTSLQIATGNIVGGIPQHQSCSSVKAGHGDPSLWSIHVHTHTRDRVGTVAISCPFTGSCNSVKVWVSEREGESGRAARGSAFTELCSTCTQALHTLTVTAYLHARNYGLHTHTTCLHALN